MSRFGHSTLQATHDFYVDHRINIETDIVAVLNQTGSNLARLALQDETGATVQHITETGADYLFSQLDFLRDEELRASRMVATILAGKRTELAYWTEAAPIQQLTVHQGIGRIVFGETGYDQTTTFRLDPKVIPAVTLQPGSFYTFEADRRATWPLVVSGLYDPGFDWKKAEVTFEPGQETIEMPEGSIRIPAGFRNLDATPIPSLKT